MKENKGKFYYGMFITLLLISYCIYEGLEIIEYIKTYNYNPFLLIFRIIIMVLCAFLSTKTLAVAIEKSPNTQ